LLVQVTVLIGIAVKGRSVAGIIHQPFYGEEGRTIWAVDGLGVHGMDVQKSKSKIFNPFKLHNYLDANQQRIVVTTRSHFTPLVQSALDILEKKKLLDKLERVGGAGYKVIKCLENSAAYVFASPGCKKWDTVIY
jgi:3'(2'), 5'-bisphosphate nucleotidase